MVIPSYDTRLFYNIRTRLLEKLVENYLIENIQVTLIRLALSDTCTVIVGKTIRRIVT